MTYNESLKCFQQSRWESLSVEEKAEAMQAMENEMALRSGREPCKVHISREWCDDDKLGVYDCESRTIQVNGWQLENLSLHGNEADSHLETILHEGRHAYQYDAVTGKIDHPDKQEVEVWTENMKEENCVQPGPGNEDAYNNQPIERDANDFAQETMRQVKEEMKQANGESLDEGSGGGDFKSRWSCFTEKLGGLLGGGEDNSHSRGNGEEAAGSEAHSQETDGGHGQDEGQGMER
ncbi:hypothetical protein DFR58_11365 [Anaerobacterium chartisolvens]|uniref:Uncharacterized protein n=1 Tax=Anaerobacterium chartisolvens TaxID=1297424 RepID=A0A369B212_9FIRM|nr:hypothetical protein [Anaerobacterium chartisolvens]RCX15483.1 hypothetical protein DFR58_11365 [Anaerobacterium chartisolvens]